jgi:hypothetical protein
MKLFEYRFFKNLNELAGQVLIYFSQKINYNYLISIIY